ncbi:MAG: alpha/beta hydrolase [Deltaproteobacteria bacterium]|nr:alpha/beta hydrolase [Deltaproteobacteria bacterium]
MQSLRKFFKSSLFSFVSLTNTQSLITRFLRADQFLPDICAPRFSAGAGIPIAQAREILKNVPSLASQAWTEYWIDLGKEFEKTFQYQAACMSYVMAAFPKEDYPWKDEANKRKRESFQKWCQQNNCIFEEKNLSTPLGNVRYYFYIPPETKGKVPLSILVNGLEGSAEEIGFSLKKHLHEGSAYATLSIPGSADYDRPMSVNSDLILRAVIDELCRNPKIDTQNIGMVGFSFGAYWTLICAKTDARIKFSLCNGTPYRHTFNPEGGIGLNPVLAHGLMCIFQVKHPLYLIGVMKKLIARADELLYKPSGPILAIDGDKDSIVDPRDTEIIGNAPGNRLIMIKNDDHCGLFHFERMTSIIVAWARQNYASSTSSAAETALSSPPAA